MKNEKDHSNCIVIVGQTGAGKSHYVKEKLLANHPKNNYIYDVNNEYGIAYCHWNLFLNNCRHKRNTLIIFEEATIFFKTSKGSDAIMEVLVRKRHTNNFIVFNFHSLRMVPLYVLDFANKIVLFKTQDTQAAVDRKYKDFELLINLRKEVMSHPNPHYYRTLKLY